MAPFALIALGIVIYVLNRDPNIHIAFRGLPWLDVPTFFVVTGVVFFFIRREFRRRARERAERRARGEF